MYEQYHKCGPVKMYEQYHKCGPVTMYEWYDAHHSHETVRHQIIRDGEAHHRQATWDAAWALVLD